MSFAARVRSLALPLVLLLAVSGLTLVGTAVPAEAATRAEKVRYAVKIVKRQVGDPYRYGAAGPNAFDCSGLNYFSYRKAGFRNFPRTSRAQASFTKRIKRRQMRPGDLMFFYGSSGVYHVGVFVGWKNGRRLMVHSPRSGERVKYAHPWSSSWFPGTVRW